MLLLKGYISNNLNNTRKNIHKFITIKNHKQNHKMLFVIFIILVGTECLRLPFLTL